MLLRQCRLSASVMVNRVEQLMDSTFMPTSIADTIHSTQEGVSPIAFPLFAADDERVLLGNGQTGCFVIARSDGSDRTRYCADTLAPILLSDSALSRMRSRANGRLEVRKELPKAIQAALKGSSVALLRPLSSQRTQWTTFRLGDAGLLGAGTALKEGFSQVTYLSQDELLQMVLTSEGYAAVPGRVNW